MRAFSASFLTVLIAAPALAQDITESVADVNFIAAQELYRGDDFVFRFPEATQVGLRLSGNVSADVEGEMAAGSNLLWPEAMTQSWEGVAGGGELTVDLGLLASLDIGLFEPITLFGFEYDPGPGGLTYAVWSESWSWTKTSFFDSVLLPGSTQPSVSIVIDETSGAAFSRPIELGFDIPLIAGYVLEPGGSFVINPDSVITVSGTSISTRGRQVTVHDGTAVVPAPQSNDGTAQFESMWVGEAASSFGLIVGIDPQLLILDETGAQVSSIGSLINNFISGFTLFPVPIASDTAVLQSRNTSYTHDLPAIDTDLTRLDFGDVEVGVDSQRNLVIENLGAIELWGDIVLEGDGFSVSRPDLEVDGDGDMVVTVTFRPDEVGEFDGDITLTSNDPSMPTIAIPVSGTGFQEGVEPDTDDGDGPDGEAGIRGCGCSSAPAGGLAWLALIPAFGFVLRRRR